MQCGGGRHFFTCLAPWGCPFPVHNHYNMYNLFISVHPAWFVFAFWLSAVFLAIQEIWKYEIWFSFIFNIIQGGQLVNQKSTKAVSDLGQAQTDWQIRLCTRSFVRSEVSCFSSLKSCVTADTFLHHIQRKAYEGVCSFAKWLNLSKNHQPLPQHLSAMPAQTWKFRIYWPRQVSPVHQVLVRKMMPPIWCLRSDGHRWGALSSADVSSNRESGSFVRDIFIN